MSTPVKWIRRAAQNAQQRAKKKGLDFNITAEDLVDQWDEQNGLCYWFDVPMGFHDEVPYHPCTPSLDRVDSGQGYVWGNVVWACLAANSAKRDTDPDCWEDFLGLIKACLGRED